jgi:hypothetical protein
MRPWKCGGKRLREVSACNVLHTMSFALLVKYSSFPVLTRSDTGFRAYSQDTTDAIEKHVQRAPFQIDGVVICGDFDFRRVRLICECKCSHAALNVSSSFALPRHIDEEAGTVNLRRRRTSPLCCRPKRLQAIQHRMSNASAHGPAVVAASCSLIDPITQVNGQHILMVLQNAHQQAASKSSTPAPWVKRYDCSVLKSLPGLEDDHVDQLFRNCFAPHQFCGREWLRPRVACEQPHDARPHPSK